MSLQGKNVVITGASMGIGRAIALAYATEGANLVLISRSKDKLDAVAQEAISAAQQHNHTIQANVLVADVQDPSAIKKALDLSVKAFNLSPGRGIDILINNAGLALGAPKPFWQQSLTADVSTMVGTNIMGFMGAAHAALNEGGMAAAGRGTLLHITSTTALETPPFPGEAVYHASKACQEAFTNALRAELVGTNIRVLALRPGVVQGHFHQQRVGGDEDEYQGFMQGIEALVAEDVARAAVWMVGSEERVSVRALDVIPSSQRTLAVFDRDWESRNR